jgi:hypothetical protein
MTPRKHLIHPRHRIFNLDEPLTVTLLAFLITVVLARLFGFLIIDANLLPESLLLKIAGFRLHHFVYGNIIVVIISFLKIALGHKIPPRFSALIYGIGLGLIIDEFALWLGALSYLAHNSFQVFYNLNIAAVFLMTTIMLIILFHRRNKT